MQAHALPLHARPRRLTRREYDDLVARGLFANERVELIHGIVVEMTPIGPRHSDPVDFLNRHFVLSVADGAVVRVQQPYAASDHSEPEPDLALVPPGRYVADHPNHAFLVVEVAESSLDYDRDTKAPLYASSNVDEYWIVDVEARRLEVYDLPVSGRYTRVRHFAADDRIAPTAFDRAVLRVGELFA